jgi:hypothetical protein
MAPVGYSWTTLLFPSLPALFRGDTKGFLVQILLAGTLIFPIFVFPRIYNERYIKQLLARGYMVRSVVDGHLDSVEAELGIDLPRSIRLLRRL